jgi:hypothetical protein
MKPTVPRKARTFVSDLQGGQLQIRVVRNAAIKIAFVAEDNDFWDCNKKLFSRNSGSGTVEAVEDAVQVIEVFPDEFADAGVVGNHFEAAIGCFILGGGTFDAAVVHKRVSDVRDFQLEDESNFVMKDANGISPTLWETSKTHCSDGRLNGGEISGGDVEGAMVIAYKQV